MTKRERFADFEKDFDACICRMVYAAGEYKKNLVSTAIQDKQPPCDAGVQFLDFLEEYTAEESAISHVVQRLLIL